MANLAQILELLKKSKGSKNAGIANALPALLPPAKAPMTGGLDEQLPPFDINALAQQTGIKPFNGGFTGQQMQPQQVGGGFLGKAKHYLLDPTYHKTTGNADIDKLHPASFLDSRLGRGLAVGLPAIAGMALTGSPVGGLAGGVIGNKFVKGREADYLEALTQLENTRDLNALGDPSTSYSTKQGAFKKERLAKQAEEAKHAYEQAINEATNGATLGRKLEGETPPAIKVVDPKTKKVTYQAGVSKGGIPLGLIKPEVLLGTKKTEAQQKQFEASQKNLQTYRQGQLGLGQKRVGIQQAGLGETKRHNQTAEGIAQQNATAHMISAKKTPAGEKPPAKLSVLSQVANAKNNLANQFKNGAISQQEFQQASAEIEQAKQEQLAKIPQKTTPKPPLAKLVPKGSKGGASRTTQGGYKASNGIVYPPINISIGR